MTAAVLAVAGCGGTSATSGGGPPPGPTTAAGHAHGGPGMPHGQFSLAAARRLPLPDAADRKALRALARGPEPTAGELSLAMSGMEDISAHPDITPGDPEVAAQLAAEVAGARAAAARLHTATAATDAGYRLASGFLPGVGAHWIDWSRVNQAFDPDEPPMLLFDESSPPRLVGLSYYVRNVGEPSGFRAAGAHWHRHAGLCIVNGALVGEAIERRADCDGGRGTLLPGRNLWMLHVWVVPGFENPLGTFAPLNSSLCSAEAPCTPDGSVPNGAPASTATTAPAGHAHLDFAAPRRHADVDGHHARLVSPLVVEVSRYGWDRAPTARQRARARALVRDTATTLRRYEHLDAAIADGYVPLPEDPVHWYRPDYLVDDAVLDPRRPEFLVYVDPRRPANDLRADEPAASLDRRVVVGAMYWAADPPAHGPQVGGPLTVWHFHEWDPSFWCGDGHGLPLATPVADACPAGAPIARSAEMLHVWTVDGPDGRFGSSMEFLADPGAVLATNLVR
jgi:hypothetical protein